MFFYNISQDESSAYFQPFPPEIFAYEYLSVKQARQRIFSTNLSEDRRKGISKIWLVNIGSKGEKEEGRMDLSDSER